MNNQQIPITREYKKKLKSYKTNSNNKKTITTRKTKKTNIKENLNCSRNKLFIILHEKQRLNELSLTE